MLQALDAYGTVVNTDSLMSTRSSLTVPMVAVSVNGSGVFLSGVQEVPVVEGIAVIADLRLVAAPGEYSLLLESQDLEASSVDVRCYACFTVCLLTCARCWPIHCAPCTAPAGLWYLCRCKSETV